MGSIIKPVTLQRWQWTALPRENHNIAGAPLPERFLGHSQMTSEVLSSSTRNIGICLQCRPYSVLQCYRLRDCCKSQGCFHPHALDQLLAGETGTISSSRCIVLAMAVTPFRRSHMLGVQRLPLR